MSPSETAPEGVGRTRRLAAVMRWLHIYGSMLGLAVLLFFSVTGITLNHPDWMLGGARRQDDLKGSLKGEWIGTGLPGDKVSRLEVVEHLRQQHGIRGAVEEFRVDEREVFVSFKGPGYSADAFVDRGTGEYRLAVVREGWVALVNDLHKGRHTGAVWSWLIDLSAALMAVVAATGLVLLLYLRRRRLAGLWIGLAGVVILVAIARWWVP